jgi:hypothetical protein
MTKAQEHSVTPDDRAAGGARLPLPPVPEPSRGRDRPGYRRLWTAVVLVLLFVFGIWLGRLLDGGEPAVARATPATVTTIVTRAGRPPASCLTALDRSDRVVHLLVRGIRDRRLSDQLKSYLAAANACRREVSYR